MKKALYFSALFFISLNTFSVDYYWVGNGGNWTEFATHWATTSGGTTFHNQIPTANDDVIFDSNSFSSTNMKVLVDSFATFKNMDWTGVLNNPSLYFNGSYQVHVYGSLTLSSNMNLGNGSHVYFKVTTPGHTIQTKGLPILFQTYFDGIGGEWTLLDDFISTKEIYAQQGIFNTGNKNVTATRIRSVIGSPTINLGSSIITVSADDLGWYSNSKATIYAGTSHIIQSNEGKSKLTLVNRFRSGGHNYHNITLNGNGVKFEDRATVNKLTFLKDGQIAASNTFDTLVLSPGYTYSFPTAGWQIIKEYFEASGSCLLPINLKSNKGGFPAIINADAPSNVLIDYANLTDIKTGGTTSFTANNSVDISGNSGWTFNQTTPCDTTCSTKTSSQSITGCVSVTINGITYSKSQVIVDTLVGATTKNCDSIITTILTIGNVATAAQTINATGAVIINGNTYTSNQTIVDTLLEGSIIGCDSIVTTTLIINETITTTKGVNYTVKKALFSPNPFYDYSSIDMSGFDKSYTVKFFNSLGTIVNETSSSDNLFILDGANLSEGVYFIVIQNNNDSFWKGKVVKIE